MKIRTVGIFSREDRLALHRFKADEAYLVGEGKKPVGAYLDIADIIRIAREAEVDAIHPGYGLLSENPDFAQACADAGIRFIGPSAEVMRSPATRSGARPGRGRGVPVVPATGALPHDMDGAPARPPRRWVTPMLKASWGGGGRGMRGGENGGSARAGDRERARGTVRLRQRRGSPGEAGAAGASRRSADPRRLPRWCGASVRTRLFGAAPQPESGRARARALPRRGEPHPAFARRRCAWPAPPTTRMRGRSSSSWMSTPGPSISSRSIRASRWSIR